jgi:hypothetical protein
MKAGVTICVSALKTGSGGFKFGPGHELLYEGWERQRNTLIEGYRHDFKHGGFIACDWYHGNYQLFWKEGNRVTLPCNVQLNFWTF